MLFRSSFTKDKMCTSFFSSEKNPRGGEGLSGPAIPLEYKIKPSRLASLRIVVDVEIDQLSISFLYLLSLPSIHTLTSFIPAASSESLMFCACAGACDPQPMTPTVLIPFQASGSLESLSRPPR